MSRFDLLAAARAEALFTSNLSARHMATRDEVDSAIRHAVRTFGGTRGCAAEVAAAYGDYPETAVLRMRWARAVVTSVYGLHLGPAQTTVPAEHTPDDVARAA
jgi:hypothetical protein